MGWLSTRPTMGLDQSKFKKNKERIDLTWPDPVKNLGRSGIKHESKTRWLFFEFFWVKMRLLLYIYIYIYIYMIFFRSAHIDTPDTWLRSCHGLTFKLSFKIIIIIIFIHTLTWINRNLPFRSIIRALPRIGPWFKF
jgi:hypothetical protein